VHDGIEQTKEMRKPYHLRGPLECVACGAMSDRPQGWLVSWINESDSDDGLVSVVFYCAYCAIRDFG
jgi:hypothetical protein